MIKIFIALFFLFVSISAYAQEYIPSSKVTRADFITKNWSGSHKFYDVYCLSFPNSKEIFGFDQRFYNGNAIHLSQALYDDYLSIYIVASSMPEGRSTKIEMNRLLELERYAEKIYNHDYNISINKGVFSPVISLRIKNVNPTVKNSPFPLVRPIFKDKSESILSLSVHRIFSRGPDRFEVAVIQQAPKGADNSTEEIMTKKLENLMTKTLESLEYCTSKLPIRKS